jgi:hypothetical protein
MERKELTGGVGNETVMSDKKNFPLPKDTAPGTNGPRRGVHQRTRPHHPRVMARPRRELPAGNAPATGAV